MRSAELFDPQQMSRHPDPRPVRLASLQFVEDRTMLALGIPERSALADCAPNTSAEGAATQSLNESSERWVAAGSRNHPVEGSVCEDHRVEVQRGFVRQHHVNARKETLQLDKLVDRETNGRKRSALRFQNSANGQQIHSICWLLQVGQESQRSKQSTGIEGCDVCAVSLPGLDYAQSRQGPNAFSEGSARNTELRSEVLFDGQPGTGNEITVSEHPLDPVDHDVSLGSHRCKDRGGFGSHLIIVGRASIEWEGIPRATGQRR
jgi:hypothetical protein